MGKKRIPRLLESTRGISSHKYNFDITHKYNYLNIIGLIALLLYRALRTVV